MSERVREKEQCVFFFFSVPPSGVSSLSPLESGNVSFFARVPLWASHAARLCHLAGGPKLAASRSGGDRKERRGGGSIRAGQARRKEKEGEGGLSRARQHRGEKPKKNNNESKLSVPDLLFAAGFFAGAFFAGAFFTTAFLAAAGLA